MANWNDSTDGSLTDQISGEIAQVARTFMSMGVCEDCAVSAATDMVMTMLAIEAPRVLVAYRDEIARQHPGPPVHLN